MDRPAAPLGFAHRGGRGRAPENTIGAFRRALGLGATGLESDAWVTADGEVVLDHDGRPRIGWRRRPVATLRRADLPGHIPTLGQLYEECGTDFDLSLDVKEPAAGAPVVEVARRYRALARLWLCSPDASLLRRWRADWPELHLVHSTRATAWPRAEDGIDVVNMRAREWTAPLVEQAHTAGWLAFGWDAQGAGELARLLGLGVDGVYSDHVGRMVAALAAARS